MQNSYLHKMLETDERGTIKHSEASEALAASGSHEYSLGIQVIVLTKPTGN